MNNDKSEIIYLASYKRGALDWTLTSELIAKWTGGEYSHSELWMLDEKKNNGTFIAYTSTPWDGKVVIEDNKTYNEVDWDYLPIKVTKEEKQTIIDFYKTIEGNKYDYFGIAGFVIPMRDRSELWFCSESAANALKIIGRRTFWSIDPARVDPVTLHRLVKIMEGL